MERLSNGDLLVVDDTTLRRVSPRGVVTTVVSGLLQLQPGDTPSGPPPASLGLAVDADGTCYVALVGIAAVRRVRVDGTVETVYRPRDRWQPTGVARHDGALYVSEYRPLPPPEMGEGPRVVKVERDGQASVLANFGPRDEATQKYDAGDLR